MLVNEGIIQEGNDISRKTWNEQPYEIRSIMSIAILREEINLMHRHKAELIKRHKNDLKRINERILNLSKDMLRTKESKDANTD